jgi:hypothetical protein
MVCPLRDGTTVVLGGTDRMNEPLRRVFAAQGLRSASRMRHPTGSGYAYE